MTGIPERGYGSFDEWRIREREEPWRVTFYIHSIGDSTPPETRGNTIKAWKAMHTTSPPTSHSFAEAARRWAGA